jgi:hypothetical protein
MKRIYIASMILLLSACGGGGGGGGQPSTVDGDNLGEGDSDERSLGVFIDSAVSGLSYYCGEYSGVTGSDGRFSCVNGDYVTFHVGGITIGSAVFAPIISPIDLVEDGGTRNHTVQNIARFLQMLDDDGDPSNGITISSAIRDIASNWESIDFASELIIDSYVSDAASVDNYTHSLPDGESASNHLESSLNITSDANPGCSIVYAGSPFCDGAQHPTCATSNITVSDISAGMTYSQVVNVMGCHGVLANVTEGNTVTLAQYTWGKATSYDWFIVFKEENGLSVLYSATKY